MLEHCLVIMIDSISYPMILHDFFNTDSASNVDDDFCFAPPISADQNERTSFYGRCSREPCSLPRKSRLANVDIESLVGKIGICQ